MNRSAKILATIYIVCTFILIINSYVLVRHISLLTIISSLALLPFIWWLAKDLDQVFKNSEKLKQTKKHLEEENSSLTESKEIIEYTIDTVDDIAIYSLNTQTNEFYISKGAEQIYGYSHKEIMSSPAIRKTVIHPEDKDMYDEKEKLVLLGEATTKEFRMIRPNREIRWLIQRETPVKDAAGNVVKIVGNIIDITDRKHLEAQLKHLAFYDELTDLANRTLLERQFNQALARSKRHDHTLGVMFIDLDGFKKVNDTLGHEAGDLLLKDVAKRLSKSVREEDLIARLGGDEFIIVFEETNKQEVEDIAQRILDKVSEPYEIDEQQANVSPSIGISMYPEDGEEQETLLQNADKAMYYAKSKGKSNFQFYNIDIPELLTKKTNIFEKIVNQFHSFSK